MQSRLNIQRFQKRPLRVEAIQVATSNAGDVAQWIKRDGVWAEVSRDNGGGVHIDLRDFADRYAAPGQFVVRVPVGQQWTFQVWDEEAFFQQHESRGPVEDPDQLALFDA